MSKDSATPVVRDLFIEELEQIQGGSTDPLQKVRELLLTTYGCCEEGFTCC